MENGRKIADCNNSLGMHAYWFLFVCLFVFLSFLLVFGLCSCPSLKLNNKHKTKTSFHYCLRYTNCKVMFSISAMAPYITRITYTVITHCSATLCSLLCSYSYKLNYIAQGNKLHMLEDASIFLFIFIKLCLYTFLLIYITSFVLNITAKYNWVSHS